MSKAIKLTKTDLAYLKFGGAARFREHLESVRIQHALLSNDFLKLVPLHINRQQLFVGRDTSALTPEQLETLNLLEGAAAQTGYKIMSSSTPVEKHSGVKILLTDESPITFDDIFNRSHGSSRIPVYIEKKGNA